MVLKWFDDVMDVNINDKQFGGIRGTSTMDALVEVLHNWYESTDKLDISIRVILLDFSKALDVINHKMLIEKLALHDMPNLRWVAYF